MKVLSLIVHNYAGIVEAEIHPGKVTIFSGQNRQGKTTLLNAIKAALGGADPIEIRHGSSRAEILVDLEDIKVRRKITPSGSTVEVTDEKGFSRKAPQSYLSSLLGAVQLNPMEFHRAKRADRTKMLLEAIARKVTFEEIIEITGEVVPGIPKEGPALLMYDLVRKYYYVLRAGKNKELVSRRELARTARAKVPADWTPDPVLHQKIGAVSSRQEVLGRSIAGLRAEKNAAERAEATRTKMTDRIRKNEGSLELAKVTLAEEKTPDIAALRKRVEDARLALRAAEEALEAGNGIMMNRDRIQNAIADMERTIAQDKETLSGLPGAFDEQRLIEAEAEAAGLDGEAAALGTEKNLQEVLSDAVAAEGARDALQAEADALDAMVIRFRDELPAQALREANLPIEGLKIDGDDITVGGIPIDNLSGAEKMELALSIVRALAADNPLKLICIDGAEQLDDESLAAFEKQAENDGFQYFITRVASTDDSGDLILRKGEIPVKGGKVIGGVKK